MKSKIVDELPRVYPEELAAHEIVNVIAKHGLSIWDGEKALEIAGSMLKSQKVMPRETDCIAQ